MGDGDGPVGGSRGEFAILVVQHFLGLHQIGQPRRHVANLVAGRLGVPGGEALIDRGVGAQLHLHRFVQDVGTELRLLAESEQPVETDIERGRDRRSGIGAGQAVDLR